MNIFNKIEKLTILTENEKALVEYIVNNPEDFISLGAEDISNASYVSTSTIYRFCQKLDLTGLAELKVQISLSYKDYLKNNDQIDYDYPFKQNDSNYQVPDKMVELYEHTLHASQSMVDKNDLIKVAEKIKNAKHIDFYTSAGNIYFAENFKFQMQEVGIHINVPMEDYLQRLTASMSDSSHLSIIASYGGRGKSIFDIVHILKDKKSPIVLITSADNPFIKYADNILYLSSDENHFNKISSFSTRLSLLYLLDCIYATYFKMNYQDNLKLKISSYKCMFDNYK